MASLLMDIGGQPGARRLTVESFFENLPAAAVSCGINAGGGLMAGRVDRQFRDWFPKTPGAGPLGVALLSIAIKALFVKMDEVDLVMRELAAGMCGWVGSDVFFAIRNFFRSDFQMGRGYSAGDIVKYQGKVWRATKDIPAVPQAVPGIDPRWEHMPSRAQGYQDEDLKMYAQAFIADPARIRAIVDDVAAEMAERGGVADRGTFAEDLSAVLGQVIQQFAA